MRKRRKKGGESVNVGSADNNLSLRRLRPKLEL